jgi:predicted dehydrogenase
MNPLDAVVIGAGLRGRHTYGAFALAHPDRLRVVAVAEPDVGRREAMGREHGLAEASLFEDWKALFDRPRDRPRYRPRLAPIAVVATGDKLHVDPALAALSAGYHVLLEKPIATDAADCLRVVEAAERAGRLLQIGHVLRFTPFYARVFDIVSSGRLGRLLSLDLREHVAGWHMTHSFVRGKFRNRQVAAPLLLAKSCHDLDLLAWLAGRAARRVVSFGGLSGYAAAAARSNVPARCTDGCPVQETCPHDAVRFYLSPDDDVARAWPWSDVSADPARAARRRALEVGPYGRCVFRCDNDGVDHQVVSVEFEDGILGTFSVHGFAVHERRTLRLTGTRGELRGVLEDGSIEVSRAGSFQVERDQLEGSPFGHYGGDEGLIDHFLGCIARDARDEIRASTRCALEGHLLGFAAEQSREGARVVEMSDHRAATSRDAEARG